MYTEGICHDGAAILKDGLPITISEILSLLNRLDEVETNNTGVKYEYLLHTWGGFYNEEFKEIHKEESGYHYFDTKEEREQYLNKLKNIEKELNARVLISVLSEGYNTRIMTTLHRVIKVDGKEYYSRHDMSPNYPFEVAKFHLEYKWQPGFNDYPLGENFDYSTDNYELIQEWITGGFDFTD